MHLFVYGQIKLCREWKRIKKLEDYILSPFKFTSDKMIISSTLMYLSSLLPNLLQFRRDTYDGISPIYNNYMYIWRSELTKITKVREPLSVLKLWVLRAAENQSDSIFLSGLFLLPCSPLKSSVTRKQHQQVPLRTAVRIKKQLLYNRSKMKL